MFDTKYIVFKRVDWEEFVKGTSYTDGKRDFASHFSLQDTVVIRLKDAFAGAALHTYANSIALTARLLRDVMPSTRKRLQDVADYFHEAAIRADEIAAADEDKLPD